MPLTSTFVSNGAKRMLGASLTLLCILGVLTGAIVKSPQVIVLTCISGLVIFYWVLMAGGERVFSNIAYLAPAIGGAYALTYPTLYYIFGLLPTMLPRITEESMFLGTVFCALFILVYCLTVLLHNGSRFKTRVRVYRELSLSSSAVLIDLVFFAYELFYLYQVYKLGGFGLILSRSISRAQLIATFNSIPLFSYAKYAFIAYSVFALFSLLNNKRLGSNRLVAFIRLAVVAVFWFTELSIGDRRGLAYILMALLLYVGSSEGGISKKTVVTGMAGLVIVLIIMGGISVLRDANSVLSQEIAIRNAFGEFVLPIITLYFYISQDSLPLLFGLSYITSPLALIPRSMLPDKQLSLANQFMVDYDPTMGYGYSPFTEAYRNFGDAGFLIAGIAIAILMCALAANKNRFPFLYLSVTMELINFFRGEFSSALIEILVIYLTLKLMVVFNARRGNAVQKGDMAVVGLSTQPLKK